MTRRVFYAFSVALNLALVFAFSACTKAPKSHKQIIHVGIGAEPRDLDPHTTTGTPETRVITQLFEGLVGKHPETLVAVPGVATHWDISKDLKTYTFHLRKDAKWSNGDPLTAEDFVYSWARLLKPETAAEYAYQAYYIVNGKEFNSGKLKDASKLGIKALDPYTLQIKLNNPTPFFLSLLYHHSLYPVHKATVEKHGPRWTRPENMVSNGAFKLKKWEMNQVIVVVPNPYYWDKDKVKLEEAHLHSVENMETEEKMFRSGKLHITYEVPQERIDYWKADKTGVYSNDAYLGVYFYWFNTQKAPVNDKRVRKALSLAIDREKIVHYVSRANQRPATMFVPPGTGGYQPISLMPKDLSRVEEARKLIKEAGYTGDKKLPKLEILYNSHEGHKKIAQAIHQMWKESLGIEVELVNQEWKVFLDSMKTGNYQVGRMGWIGDYNDPNTFLDLMVTGTGNNLGRYSNPEYDKLIALAAHEANPKKRFEYFRKAETLILEEAPVLPIYIYTKNFLMSKEVRGWFNNIEDIHPLKAVSLVFNE